MESAAAGSAARSVWRPDVLAVARGARGRLHQPGEHLTRVDLPEPERPITTNTSPLRDGEGDVTDGDHVAGLLLQLLAGELGVRALHDLVGLGPEDLPEPLDVHGDVAVGPAALVGGLIRLNGGGHE